MTDRDPLQPLSQDQQTAIATLQTAIARLRQLSQSDIQTHWHWDFTDWSISDLSSMGHGQDWAIAPLNHRQHIAWPKGQRVVWLCQTVRVPQTLQGYDLNELTLRLALTWWADSAQIFVNGQFVQAGDLFDCVTRICLSPATAPGQTFHLAIRLISPGHDDGALVRSRLICEHQPHQPLACPEPGFVADELATLQQYLTRLAPDKLAIVAQVTESIAWEAVGDRTMFHQSLIHLRHRLRPFGDWLKQRQIHYLGHAHLDLAWLWPIADTWVAAERTFASVLQLQQDFPHLIFTHSSPALYAWIEEQRPDLFAQIQKQVANGTWEIAAGLWVEPELNLVSGESIARQVLYGQHYVQAKFGKPSAIAWLPDSFGFCWQLPQILKQGGIDYFVTQKLRWNDSTQFPYGLFQWQAPDGSQIVSLMSPPIGEQMDPVKITDYASTWEQQTGLTEALWLPGVGDHGGGPTRDMLEMAARWEQSPLFPQLRSTSALGYLQRVTSSAQADALPVWNDELYLEFHRGCYTSHADQKRFNRRCEVKLYQAELYATLATILTEAAYPKTDLEAAWKQVLFNQFHDILPGSAIPEVFVEANQAWQAAEKTATQILDVALGAIAQQIALPTAPHAEAIPFVVFNPSNWARSQVLALPLPSGSSTNGSVQDSSGQAWPTQFAQRPEDQGTLLLLTPKIPSLGYQVLWWVPQSVTSPEPLPETWVLENEYLRVTVDPATGDLSSVFDQTHQREVLSGPGNQLQAFQDQGQYWDAWNIDPDYAQHPLPPSQLVEIRWLESGPLRSCLRVVRQIGRSRFCQDYILTAQSPLLQIQTTVDWQERHVLVKAAFPLTVEADTATYEIPYGAIRRPTQPQTPAEKAKWEVPALQWADLSQKDYGVSLLNDCKYGYDSQPHQLRLTLLRGSTWPDPDADLGHHEFTYALYPHGGNWRAACTVQAGYALNQPLLIWQDEILGSAPSLTRLPPTGEFLSFAAKNWILTALKPAEDGQGYILRGYECQGEEAVLHIQGDLETQNLQAVNLLEQPRSEPDSDPVAKPDEIAIAPWKISSFRCNLRLP